LSVLALIHFVMLLDLNKLVLFSNLLWESHKMRQKFNPQPNLFTTNGRNKIAQELK